MCCSATSAWAYDAQLDWAPVAGVAGYKVYLRQSGASFSAGTDVGNPALGGDGQIHSIVNNLTAGVTNYFAVTAYNSTGTESALSNELSLMVSATPTPTVSSAATAGTAVPTATSSTTSTATATRTATSTAPAAPTASSTATATTGTAVPTATPSPTTTPAPTAAGATIWGPTATPAIAADPEAVALELGVKFTSDVNGLITGIRYYKSTTNTGTHTGSLWSNAGVRLATATFTNETASGWQQVTFATPVAITANTVYVASYHTDVGHYAADPNYFAAAGVDNPPLHALRDGMSGANGVYVYGASAFPTSSYQASNYWVDVVFATAPGATPTQTATGTATRTTTATNAVPPTATNTVPPTATASASPSATGTATRTTTSTATNTAPPTGTATATRTATASGTATHTATPPATATSTATSSRTATATATATRTATASGTATPPATATSTATWSSTPTATATSSASASATGTATRTATSTATNTAPPTGTATATRTASPSSTATATYTDTPLPTATNSASPSATATATHTASATSTAPPTGTATATHTAWPSLTPTDTYTATPLPTDTAAATATHTAPPGTTATDTPPPAATETATYTVTALPTDTATATASELPSAPATETAVPSATVTAVPTGTNTLAPLPTETATAVATQTAPPSATPTAIITLASTVAVSFTPTPTATAVPDWNVSIPNSIRAMPGTPVSVPVTIDPASGVRQFALRITFDPNVVAVQNVALSATAGAGALDADFSTPGDLTLSATLQQPLTGDGLVDISFAVVGTCPSSTSLSIASCVLDGGAIGCQPSDGSVLVSCGIAGRLRQWRNGASVAGATVTLQESGTSTAGITLTTTNELGQFGFDDATTGSWRIEPQKSGELQGAVTAYDAAIALQAAAGGRQLDSMQALACDVTSNGQVTALDGARILQFVVGNLPLPVANKCGSDWAFVPEPAALPNQRLVVPQPTGKACQPGGIVLDPLQGDAPEQDFSAVLFGDCSGNWSPAQHGTPLLRAASDVRVRLGSARVRAGGLRLVPLYVSSTEPFMSIDARVASDPTAVLAEVRLVGTARNAMVAFQSDARGGIVIALASPSPIAADGGPLAVLVFKAPQHKQGTSLARMLSAAVDESGVRIGN